MDDSHTVHGTPPATPAPATSNNDFVKRELNGTTFLSLEHVAHMALTVLLPLMLIGGVSMLLSMWWSIGSGIVNPSAMMTPEITMSGAGAATAIGLFSALAVLTPVYVVLDRRTRAEWAKRPGYTKRLAYKLPVYGAIAALGATMLSILITMVTIVVTSLASLGLKGADIGQMYLDSFMPSLIAFLVLGCAQWYVIKLAKGRDNGKMFSLSLALAGVAVAAALLVTAVIDIRKPAPTPVDNPGINYPFQDDYNDSYDELQNDLESLRDIYR